MGYFSDLPVLDLSGLVSPDALAAKVGGNLSDLLARRRPRYVVYTPFFVRWFPVLEELRTDPAYAPMAAFANPRPGLGDIVLLARSPPSSAPLQSGGG